MESLVSWLKNVLAPRSRVNEREPRMAPSGITVLVLDHSKWVYSRPIGRMHPLGTITAVSAPGHADAVHILETLTPEFILVEHQDGSVSPLEWLTKVHRQSPRVPVALIAGTGGEQLLVEALQVGAAGWNSKSNLDHFLKPVLQNFLVLAGKDGQHHGLVGYLIEHEAHLELGNDQTLLSVILGVLQEELLIRKLWSQSECIHAGIALGEALMNALYHGNLDVSSILRNSDERAYLELADTRRSQSPYKDRRIHVNVRIDDEQATFVVRDQGAGFDIMSLPNPTDPANLEKGSGRGILLMRSFMDEVRYNAVGNQVVMIKRV
ncbi:MAG TPA: ATP-binding protein, partial [Terriglobia bacterium]|nr:ATP-binding protein [Terriglobia bacterium]